MAVTKLPPPYSRWREIKSLVSRFWNVVWHGGTADVPLSARAFLEAMPQQDGIDTLFYRLKGEVGHCENWARVETYRALDQIEKARQRGILPGVERAWQAKNAGVATKDSKG